MFGTSPMKLRFISHWATFFVLTGIALAAPASSPRYDAMQRWQSNRFGLFIHWGPVSLTGQEISWSRANSNTNCPNNGATPVNLYDNLYKNFDPTNFNASEWVGIATAAAMKYIVL